jgi:HK97 family phage portal protein
MTFLQQLLSVGSSLSPEEERFWTGVYSPVTASGMRVSADSALKISTAWACTRLIAETVAMLPRIIFERFPDESRERATNHPLYDILHDQPNKRQTSFEFVDMLQMHALLRGSGYAKIVPGPRGPVDRLIPIHPDRVIVEEIDDETVRYQITERDGTQQTYNQEDIFELRGLTLDGINTVSVITYARESMGLTLAAEYYGAAFFGNDSRPGGYLRHPKTLSNEAKDRLIADWEATHRGLLVAHRASVLEEGMEWQSVGLSQKDSQFLETREFQAEDVTRWFRVPPHMVGLTSKATSWGSGIEELSRGFVTYVLMPWLVRWQQMIHKDLIIASERFFVEFLTEALLRGDIEKRYNAYKTGRQWGWLATNEIRRAENMNPREGGDDDYLEPLNMKRWDEPATERTPSGRISESTDAHYERLLIESAGRVVRKELAAMARAAKRCEDTHNGDWVGAVDEFFGTHAEFVSQTMCIPAEAANMYVSRGRSDLLAFGPGILEGWEARRTDDLVALVLEVA